MSQPLHPPATGVPVDARSRATRRRRATSLPALLFLLATLVAACASPAASPSQAPASPVAQRAGDSCPDRRTDRISDRGADPGPDLPAHADRRRGDRVTSRPSRRRSSRSPRRPRRSLFALGAGDRLVGKARTSTTTRPRPPTCPTSRSSTSVDVEKIVGLGADLVIAGGNGFNPPEAHRPAARARDPGRSSSTRPTSTSVPADIGSIGQATGDARRGRDDHATTMRAQFDEVARRDDGAARQPRDVLRDRRDREIYGPAPTTRSSPR